MRRRRETRMSLGNAERKRSIVGLNAISDFRTRTTQSDKRATAHCKGVQITNNTGAIAVPPWATKQAPCGAPSGAEGWGSTPPSKPLSSCSKTNRNGAGDPVLSRQNGGGERLRKVPPPKSRKNREGREETGHGERGEQGEQQDRADRARRKRCRAQKEAKEGTKGQESL